jgi:hypothetical protein
MRKQNYTIFFNGIFFLFFIYMIFNPLNLSSQENDSAELLQEKAIKVFLDVSRWYQDYIKNEIPFVNYVRDPKQAQVYIMITDQRTGAGGEEYTIKLIGQNNFETVNDTVVYVSRQSDPEEVTRRGIVKVLKLGLIRYVEKTPLAEFLNIRYEREATPTDVIDRWNYWVFTIDLDIDMSGEESRNRFALDQSFSADRVTPESKISLRVNYDQSHRKDKLEEGWETTNLIRKGFRGLYVKSINNHWSAGVYANFNSSTYSNIKFSFDLAPAIEYNVFPYSDYTSREFRFLYRTVFKRANYFEETIFNKKKETLFYESLSATFELKKRWGSLTSTLEGLHYFHDFQKNRLEFYNNIDLRLFEGFSLDIRGTVSMIRDQLSLSKEEASETDILTRRREIATDYDYYLSFGFRYTFGSIYSNVVNPRFGSGRRYY